MRKSSWVAVGLMVMLSGCGAVDMTKDEKVVDVAETGVTEVVEERVEVVVDAGEEGWSGELEWVEGESVFELLRRFGEGQGLELEWEEYDFGVLVTAIGGYENTAEKVWIYTVNGETANVGAGQRVVEARDRVEWEYQEMIN